jgi:ribonuclease E
MADLKLPPSMGCIVRTAGLQRTKVEIKRDFDYLARLWDGIRETTLASSAPALVYGDSDLMKRAIRDIYNKDIDEVIVEGDDGYRQAKDFMKLLMPSHARRVKHYSDPVPLFQRAGVEDQLSAMYHPVVQLKSGGYLVINPTEALVSIDINSGRSTREHNIEQTATATNLEATAEIARQLRLRDMAGLVVIDFIDMDHSSNVRKVEKAMKEAMKNDRARIQVGRISSFGLMEMSRQRLRTGVLEASTRPCPHCEGSGFVRTASSAGLSALRLIEDEAARGRGSLLLLRASAEAAFYLLNRKRAELAEIEERYGVSVEVASDGEAEGARMSVEASGPPPAYAPRFDTPMIEVDEDIEDEIDEEEVDEEEEAVEERAPREPREPREPRNREGETEAEGDARRKRRRRRGRRGRARPEGEGERTEAEVAQDAADDAADDAAEAAEASETVAAAPVEATEGEGEGGRRRRGRRGRRGGRRSDGETGAESESVDAVVEETPAAEAIADAPADVPFAQAEEASAAPAKRSRRRKPVEADAAPEAPAAEEPIAEPVAETAPEDAAKPKRARRAKAATTIVAEAPAPAEEAPAKPKRASRGKKAAAPIADTASEASAIPLAETAPEGTADAAPVPGAPGEIDPDPGEAGSARRGWWQRTFGA